jgi:hypothetical protein
MPNWLRSWACKPEPDTHWHCGGENRPQSGDNRTEFSFFSLFFSQVCNYLNCLHSTCSTSNEEQEWWENKNMKEWQHEDWIVRMIIWMIFYIPLPHLCSFSGPTLTSPIQTLHQSTKYSQFTETSYARLLPETPDASLSLFILTEHVLNTATAIKGLQQLHAST